MKVKNRATGSVCELVAHGAGKYITEFAVESEDGSEIATYSTIDELQEYWETYEPKEPLIKDENIRKAVRAWAEALGLQEVYCASNGYEIYGGIDDWIIQFEGEPFPFAGKNKIYTIAELCGEEEE